ncbi:hypothetical protein [Variovorax sp. UMC13]|uniref:hypothetical protein n=1 Tax=Variovorax sp. UMC13 TaxID=1862326 RepID=UPI0016011DE8|nr:hypothetical protein [Variovorax sp. UMC13]MBB1598680.1 hypothetical protein [Variovorax sp. UMC13]
MKLIHEVDASICSLTFSVGPSADAVQDLLDLHDFDDLDAEEVRLPCPSVSLGGLRFMWLRHHAAITGNHVPLPGDEDPAYPLQLLVTSDGECVTYAASGHSMDAAASTKHCAVASSATAAWLIGLPAPLITRWLRVTPAAAAYRLDAQSDGGKALCTYLRAWHFDELEALASPFEKELIAEHVMGLLAMAVAPPR